MRRTLSLLLLLVLCIPALTHAQSSPAHLAALDKDAAELSTYALTMDTVSRLFQATHAATEAAKADPSIKVSFAGDPDADSPTIDQLAGKIAGSPKLVTLLAGYSFTPREFSAATMSLIQTGLALMAVQSGQKPEDVTKSAHTNPANMKLLVEHRAEIEELRKKYPSQ